MLTISDEDADVMDAILAGACGYLLKDASIDELMAGIRAAWRGESLISPTIAAKVLQRVRATSANPEIAEAIRSELSDREIEVLKLIANGKDNAVIAAELHISPKTVKNHISNILMKLQIDNRIQAAVYAVRSGIVYGDRRVPQRARARLQQLQYRRSRPISAFVCVSRFASATSSSVTPLGAGSSTVWATSPNRRSIRDRSASSASASA